MLRWCTQSDRIYIVSYGADVQLGYMRDCHNSAGGWAFVAGLCNNNAVAIGCTGDHQNEKGMADIMAHEIGHVLGKNYCSDFKFFYYNFENK